MPKVADPPAGMITAGQASRLLDLTLERLRQLAKAGAIPKAVNGNYPLVPTVQGYIRFLKDEERRTSKSASASRVQEARAHEIELRTAERRREMIPVDDAIGALDFVVGRCVTEMTGLPVRFTRDVSERRKLEEEVDGCRRRIVASIRDASLALRSGGDVLAAAGEADAG